MRLLQIDAFTSEAFRGNPAAVCLLGEERDAAWMQNVAMEMNLSETALWGAGEARWTCGDNRARRPAGVTCLTA